MNKKIIIALAIMVLVVSIIIVLNNTEKEKATTFDVKTESPGKLLVVLDSNGNLSLPYFELNDTLVYYILMNHSWDNWSYKEKLALANIMAITARGRPFDEGYMNEIAKLNNSQAIFSTYMDLLKNAGY